MLSRGLRASGIARLALRSTSLRLPSLISERNVRIGFFRSDKDFIDPEDPLHSDDPLMKKSVLERNNVGMGMVLLNSVELDHETIGALYFKLRNLEVNTMKRVVALTSTDRELFSLGLDAKQELLLAESAIVAGRPIPVVDSIIENRNDLVWLVHTYLKPLVLQSSGHLSKGAAGLWANALYSAAYTGASADFDFASAGQALNMGASAALLKAPLGWAEFLTLTGAVVDGASLFHLDICSRWMAREALPVMELTSGNLLRVSEATARALVEEHALEPPTAPDLVITLRQKVADVFGGDGGVKDILERLEGLITEPTTPTNVLAWATDCKRAILQRSPSIQEVNLQILRHLRAYQSAVLEEVKVSPADFAAWQRAYKLRPTAALGSDQDSEAQLVEEVRRLVLQRALTLEHRAAKYLHTLKDTLEAQRVALLAGTPYGDDPSFSFASPHALDNTEIMEVFGFKSLHEVSPHSAHRGAPLPGYLQSEDNGQVSVLSAAKRNLLFGKAFLPRQRSELPLSAHPKLRTAHPDYDASTGLDHEPTVMERERRRWSPGYLAWELKEAETLITQSQQLRKQAKEAVHKLKAAGVI